MKTIIKLEELGIFLLSLLMYEQTGFSWWWFPVLLMMSDISMVGYIFNNRIGAFLYNLFHHKGVAILVFSLGYLVGEQYLELTGVILFGHSSLDRVAGYGLKYADSFHRTHLGRINQK
jgi:hypothetical protein